MSGEREAKGREGGEGKKRLLHLAEQRSGSSEIPLYLSYIFFRLLLKYPSRL